MSALLGFIKSLSPNTVKRISIWLVALSPFAVTASFAAARWVHTQDQQVAAQAQKALTAAEATAEKEQKLENTMVEVLIVVKAQTAALEANTDELRQIRHLMAERALRDRDRRPSQ